MSSADPLTVQDLEARRTMAGDLDTTLFVEAGAGTGKTTAIVERIVALIGSGRARADTLVAITFTEAAAGELRQRVRDALECATTDEKRSATERELCEAAATSFDCASITTIHAFNAELLRSHSTEAGLPPQLEIIDAVAQELERRERFRDWFDSAAEREWGAPLSRCLELGITPQHLEPLMAELDNEADLLVTANDWPAPTEPDAVAIVGRMAARFQDVETSVLPQGHLWAEAWRRAGLARERCIAATTEAEAVAALLLAERLPAKGGGDKREWTRAGGDPGVVDAIGDARRDALATVATLRSIALCGLLPHLRDWVLVGVAQRRRRGVATFQDLLAWARDLLHNHEVRRRCHERWTHIVIDEFQDTDPLQAELAVLLSAPPDVDPGTTSWLQAPISPGRLCVVGDPKQSIYRFRRADIALYEEVRCAVERSDGAVVTLSRNHRSVPRILDMVNAHFARTMVAREHVQPAYVPLHAHCDDAGAGVWMLGADVDGAAAEVWATEAIAVAGAARQVHEDGWRIRDVAGGERRPAMFRDICVLVPTRTNLRRLERAFDEYEVPYRLESGVLILETQEVRELLATLRCIDDPSDQVALVAALRAPAYGCSDRELFRWVSDGGRLDPLRPGNADVPRVASALHDLAGRHHDRHQGSVAGMIEQLIEDRMLDVLAFAEARPREVLRRLQWVVEQARTLAASGRDTLREIVDSLETMAGEGHRDSIGAATETDEDAVRVMTVHGAKGLEFPIVMLTGLGSDPAPRAGLVLVDRVAQHIEARCGTQEASFATPGYSSARADNTELAKAEHQRMLYVAATRARDHLVVSVFHSSKGARGADARAFRQTLNDARQTDPELGPTVLTEPWVTPHHEIQPESVDDDWSVERENDWLEARRTLIDHSAAERRSTATQLAHSPDDANEIALPQRGRGGSALGRAVHAVLQNVDLSDIAGIAALARVHAATEGIPDRAPRVAELVETAWRSAPVRRAIAARHWREIPVGAMLDGTLVEGVIDLLYEAGDALVVVDYKTDDVSGGELQRRLERYEVQGAVYALLVSTVTGRKVERCEFVLAATGDVHTAGRSL